MLDLKGGPQMTFKLDEESKRRIEETNGLQNNVSAIHAEIQANGQANYYLLPLSLSLAASVTLSSIFSHFAIKRTTIRHKLLSALTLSALA
jgi:hypothetical protein